MSTVTIVGGGLAGSEAALQLASRGVPVRLIEMRPHVETGAHRSAHLGEIVCSNSFKSTLRSTASGLLKAEMELLGCRLLEIARSSSVPAGHALAVDREIFSQEVTGTVEAHPGITVIRECVDSLELPAPVVIATGPLTAEGLARALAEHASGEHLYFYDAIAPSVDGDTVDASVGFWASRYGKGEADYLNLPLDEADYARLLDRIRSAERAEPHPFEEEAYFEACLPIEVLAARGTDTLRYGPLKPRGLADPRTGREPYAVVQLRQESRQGSLLGLVGFQTRMKQGAQREVIRSLPGLGEAAILRYGSIHRNMFLDMPRLCTPYLRDRRRPGLFYAGQICGVEGYVESIMSAMVASLCIYAELAALPMSDFPANTMIGALMSHVHSPADRFQPMNANMGILPHDARHRGRRRERYEARASAALVAMAGWHRDNARLFAAA